MPRVIRGDFRSDGSTGAGYTYGIYTQTTVADVADASFRLATRGYGGYAGYFVTSTVKVERTSLLAIGDRSQITNSSGFYQQAGNVQIYDSLLYGGAATTNSYGLYQSGGQLFLGGNTIATGQSNGGFGIYCQAGTMTARNNHVTVSGVVGDLFYAPQATCSIPANWDHNAFYKYSPTGPYEDVDSVATAPAGSADAEGDRILTSPCLDPQYPVPDARILAGSACVGNGGTPLRRDGSTRTLDLYRGPRIEGTMMDIGAHESP
jgi:hypothetical protein